MSRRFIIFHGKSRFVSESIREPKICIQLQRKITLFAIPIKNPPQKLFQKFL